MRARSTSSANRAAVSIGEMVHRGASSNGSRTNGVFGGVIGGLLGRPKPPRPYVDLAGGAFGSGGGNGSPLRPQAAKLTPNTASAANATLRRRGDVAKNPIKAELPYPRSTIAETRRNAKAPALPLGAGLD